MDNMNTQQPETKENNKLIIIIAACVMAALVAVFVIVGVSLGWFGGKKSDSAKTTTVQPGQIPASIKVLETKGSEDATKKIKISVRDVKFGDTIKKVKAFEKTQEDTLNHPSEATVKKDGITYLTYTFSPKAEFYGVKPGDINKGALLQYVFKNKRLFDMHVQFGDISKKDQKKIRTALKSKYGKPTFYEKKDGDIWRELWRSSNKDVNKQTNLRLSYSPASGMIVSYESIGRDFGKK